MHLAILTCFFLIYNHNHKFNHNHNSQSVPQSVMANLTFLRQVAEIDGEQDKCDWAILESLGVDKRFRQEHFA